MGKLYITVYQVEYLEIVVWSTKEKDEIYMLYRTYYLHPPELNTTWPKKKYERKAKWLKMEDNQFKFDEQNWINKQKFK